MSDKEEMMDKLKKELAKETNESLRANLSTYQTNYQGAEKNYLQEMKDTKATFSYKSSRLKRCSYGVYSKDVFNIEEAFKELEDLESMFDKLALV